MLGPWTHHGNTILHHDNTHLIAAQHVADDPPLHESVFWGLDPEIYEARKAAMMEEARQTGQIHVQVYLDRGDILQVYYDVVGDSEET